MPRPGAARIIVALALLAVPTPALADSPPVTWEEVRNLPHDCPIVYDNDWLRDVTDDEYLFAKASLGQADLKGIILTVDSWDDGKLYTVEQGLEDFRQDIAIARRSGLRNIPGVTVGADRELVRPESGRVEDTEPVPSAGTDLIVAEARKASPDKPLVVIVGGPLITVAGAYLTDPAIADRMVVLMTDIDGYNGSDPWANEVVATRCKLVNFGADRLWWPQRPEPPVMPPGRFEGLPDTEVTREMERVAEMYWDRSTRRERPDRDDGFGDGAGTLLLFKPETWLEVQDVQVTGAWSHRDVSDGPYHYLDAIRIDAGTMSDEFFATMEAALRTADNPESSR